MTINGSSDGQGGFLTGGNRFDHGGRAGDNIPAGINTVAAGCQIFRIHRNHPTAGDFDIFIPVRKRNIRNLADGRNNHIGSNGEFRTGNRHRIAPAGLILTAQFHTDTFYTGDFTGLHKNFLRGSKKFDFNAFGFTGGNFFVTCRHFLMGTTIHNHHFFSVETESRTRGINGDIAAANHNCFGAGFNLFPEADIP